MAKKRDHRSAPSSGHRENRFQPPSRRNQRTDSTASSRSKLIALFIVSSVIAIVAYWLRQSSPSQSKHKESYVYQRGLVTTDANYQDIVTENSNVPENSSHRHYTYPVLGYITPWNSRGYELAKRFNSKFTHLSPVWYDLKRYVLRS